MKEKLTILILGFALGLAAASYLASTKQVEQEAAHPITAVEIREINDHARQSYRAENDRLRHR